MGTITKTIGSGGGRDYSTIQAWEDALPANLVTDGNIQVGQCFNDSEFAVSGAPVVTFSGSTTSASFYIQLTTGPGQSFADNANVQSNALFYNASNGVALRATSNYQPAISLSDNNVLISKLQCKGGVNARIIEGTSTGFSCDGCILQVNTGTDRAVQIAGNPVFSNSLVLSAGAADTILRSSATLTVQQCTLVALSGTPANGAQSNYNDVILFNCLVYNCTALGSAGGALTITTCQSDIASGSGWTQQTAASQFQNVATDFRLKTSAPASGAGTANPSYPIDIAGTTRPQQGRWDIGAWEVAGPPLVLQTICMKITRTRVLDSTGRVTLRSKRKAIPIYS